MSLIVLDDKLRLTSEISPKCCVPLFLTARLRSLKFHPGRPVFDKGTKDFTNSRSAIASPLAEALFKINGVSSVFFGPDFVTVTKKTDELEWSEIKPKIMSAIMDFYSSGVPIIREDAAAQDAAAADAPEDDEVLHPPVDPLPISTGFIVRAT